eukprot:1327566-Pleurochrysis_carterae.AAC.1
MPPCNVHYLEAASCKESRQVAIASLSAAQVDHEWLCRGDEEVGSHDGSGCSCVSICSCVVSCSVAFSNGIDGGMVSSSFASMLSFTTGGGAACGASYGPGGIAGGAGGVAVASPGKKFSMNRACSET